MNIGVYCPEFVAEPLQELGRKYLHQRVRKNNGNLQLLRKVLRPLLLAVNRLDHVKVGLSAGQGDLLLQLQQLALVCHLGKGVQSFFFLSQEF